MIQIGDRAGFSQVRLGIFRAFHAFPMRHLDHHEPLQLVVVSQVDEAETALAQDPLNTVAADSLGLLIGRNVTYGGFRSVRRGNTRFVRSFWTAESVPACLPRAS